MISCIKLWNRILNFYRINMDFFLDFIELSLAAVWIIISIVSMIISFIQSFKIERLKTKLEIEKNKAVLNDSKIRKAYEDFVSSIMNFNNQEKAWEIEEWIKNFTKNSLLFSWKNTIHAINKYKTSTPKNNKEEINLVENIIY